MGDFNYRAIDWKLWNTSQGDVSEEASFISAAQDAFLYQHITEPTRIRHNNEPSILDLIFTNIEDMIETPIMESSLGKSDHAVIKFQINCSREYAYTKTKKFNFKKGNYDELRRDLDKDWDRQLDGCKTANSMYQKLCETLLESIDAHVPKVNCNKPKKTDYPIDAKSRHAIKKKHRSWQRYRESGSDDKYRDYCRARNKVKTLIKNAKRKYEKDIATEVKSNPKKFWLYANSKTKTRSGISELHVKNGDQITIAKNDEDKANALADFFTSVFTIEPEGDIPRLESRKTQSPPLDRPITEKEVETILNNLNENKSPGPDSIHPRLLKELKEVLGKPLCKIFNKSLESGEVPDDWKAGNITAVYKKGSKYEPGNYRPISLTCIICKIMEKLIRNRLMEHFSVNNNFLSKQQFGFVPGRSTVLQLLKVLDEWTEALDKGGSINAVYMDFMKAFDTVPHKRLIGKMEAYGFSRQLINWVKDFLTNRRQRVIVNGEGSTWRKVTSGIPQGSVLGPILFVIYINDLPECTNSTAYLFADDTKIFKSTLQEANLQEDLDALQEWSDKWLLRFHPDKCKELCIGKKPSAETLHLYKHMNKQKTEVNLEKESEEKDLGIIIDSELKFGKHIQQAINKANRNMGIIRRSYTFLDEDSFKLLYKALVRPHLEYGASTWNPYQTGHINKLESVQKRATRQVPALKGLNYNQRIIRLGLPTLKYRRYRGDMIQVYKLTHDLYDNIVTEGFLTVTKDKSTRGNSLTLSKNRSRLDVRKFSFTQRIVNAWNLLPEVIVQAPSLPAFERRLDKFWGETARTDPDADYSKKPGSYETNRQQSQDYELDIEVT